MTSKGIPLPENLDKNLEFIRILWCDNANIIRSKAVYINKEMETSESELKVGISRGQQGVPVMYDQVLPDSLLSPVGEIELRPDFETLIPLPYAPGHYRTMGDMKVNGKTWDCCPRGYLKRIVKKFSKINLTVQASYENEFYLLKYDEDLESSKNIIPLEKTPFASTYSMDLNHDFIREVVDALQVQNIKVEQYYPESGPGQQEITIKHQGPLTAADNQIAFRETLKALSIKKDWEVSFLPKIFPDQSGSGSHLHLSLWRNGENILGDADDTYGISKLGRHFIAGILHHLPGLMALTTPSTNSYHRIKPNNWCGSFQCWGIDNREAAIRIISEKEIRIKHFELKTVDASSNPYLALGGVLTAGYDGIINEMKLPAPVQLDPGILTSEELIAKKINSLPGDLKQALHCLEKNNTLLSSLGSELSQAYLAVKKAEYDYFKDLSLEEEVKILWDKF